MAGDVLGPSANAEDFVAIQALRPIPDIAKAVALQLMYRAVRGFDGIIAVRVLGNGSTCSRGETQSQRSEQLGELLVWTGG